MIVQESSFKRDCIWWSRKVDVKNPRAKRKWSTRIVKSQDTWRRIPRLDWCKSDSSNFQGNVAEEYTSSTASENRDTLVVVDRSEPIYHWILNSGCHSMTLYREWCHTYKPWDSGVIYLDDNTSCPVVRVGDVQVKMFNCVIQKVSNTQQTLHFEKVCLHEKFCKQGLTFISETDHLKKICQ